MHEVGEKFEDWVKPTFTDWGLLQDGTIVCDACLFCFIDKNAQLAARVGKAEPQRFRNYSHFVTRDGAWVPLTKGNKPEMLDILLHTPQVAVIADSGQKHIAFRGKPGWWQFEELAMRPSPAVLLMLRDLMVNALAVFSKAEIESGRYGFSRIEKFGVVAYQEFEGAVKTYRGSPVFALALFLAQKEEEDGPTTTNS
jgi:hypothetical protein